MDIHVDLSATDAKFGLYAASGYELTVGGLSVAMSAEQFQQLCDNLRPWVVDRDDLAVAMKRLVSESVGHDGSEYEDGEWIALDLARAALARIGGAA
jgi:hypothetical protein